MESDTSLVDKVYVGLKTLAERKVNAEAVVGYMRGLGLGVMNLSENYWETDGSSRDAKIILCIKQGGQFSSGASPRQPRVEVYGSLGETQVRKDWPVGSKPQEPKTICELVQGCSSP